MTELKKIIEHALAGNKEAVKAYAYVLAENFKKEANEQGYRMVMRALEPHNPMFYSPPVALDGEESKNNTTPFN